MLARYTAGPAGASVREIMRVTGSDIKSWTDNASKSRTGAKRPCRVFVVDGDEDAVSRTVDIITAAVDRYKELCEGRCQGKGDGYVRASAAAKRTCIYPTSCTCDFFLWRIFQWPCVNVFVVLCVRA